MRLLDTTLRDGSYVINFQFSADDTRTITNELDQSGIELIEVGHGAGLGASEKGHGIARETDENYMKAASAGVKNALWGMFCIPGVAELKHLDMAAGHGMGFIRVGVGVDRVLDGKDYIAKAKNLGLYVAVNFMKSYTKSADDFARNAAQARDLGADIVYIVDSAGNMLPSEIRNYIEAVRAAVDIPIGLHLHNNLGLANANAIEGLHQQCAIIDVSLQGIGRCTGNTVTEEFIAILERLGRRNNYDFFRLMDAGENFVRPRLSAVGHDTVDLVCGLSGFHSSYMNVIRDAALAYDVDPRRLIIELCKETRENAPEDLVNNKARMIAAADTNSGFRHRFPLRQYFGHEQDAIS